MQFDFLIVHFREQDECVWLIVIVALSLCTYVYKFMWQFEWKINELLWFLEGTDETIGNHIRWRVANYYPVQNVAVQ